MTTDPHSSSASEAAPDQNTSDSCEYTFNPSEHPNARLQSTWECPHPAHPESQRCIFHMSHDERASLEITTADLVTRLETNLASGEQKRNEYIDATLPHLPLTYQTVSSSESNTLTLNFQYATIEGIDITGGGFAENLDIRAATVGELVFRESTVEGDVEADDATFTDRFTTEEATFNGDVHFSGADFDCEVTCDETVFNEDTSFADAVFRNKAQFRNIQTQGTSHALNDHISFRDATFHDTASFKQATFRYATFEGATFAADVTFDHATFDGDTIFSGVEFRQQADFDEIRVLEDAAFDDTIFHGLAEFRGAHFTGGSRTVDDDVSFAAAEFKDTADFKLAQFRYANFTDAAFHASANFDRATFTAPAIFDGIVADGSVTLTETQFDDDAQFREATFERKVNAEEAEFDGDADFSDGEFATTADFDEVRFREDASFKQARFHGTARFRGALFEGESKHLDENASFRDAVFMKDAEFESAEFQNASFWDVEFRGQVTFTDAAFHQELEMRVEGGDVDIYVDFTDATIGGGIIEELGGNIVPYDLTRATLGTVQLKGENIPYELLDYFRFCLTDFDDFDFSNHHTYLEQNDWQLHAFVQSEATVVPAVEMTNDVIEETYRRAKESADSVGDTTAMRHFEFWRWYYNRQKNYELIRSEHSLNALTKMKKASGIGLNLFMQYTCGYANRVPRILLTMAGITVLYGFLYTLGGPFETSVGVIWGSEPLAVLYNGTYYSGITFTTIGYGNNAPEATGWIAKLLAASEGYISALLFTLLTVTFMRSAIGSS